MTPMKLSQMPYARPDLAGVREKMDAHRRAFAGASSAAGQLSVLQAWDRDSIVYDTSRSLAGLRYQCDTRSTAAVVALTVMTLFVPCIANFLMIVRERGVRVGVGILAFITPVAVLTGALLHYVYTTFNIRF